MADHPIISSRIVVMTPPCAKSFQPQRWSGTLTQENRASPLVKKRMCSPEVLMGLHPKQLLPLIEQVVEGVVHLHNRLIA